MKFTINYNIEKAIGINNKTGHRFPAYFITPEISLDGQYSDDFNEVFYLAPADHPILSRLDLTSDTGEKLEILRDFFKNTDLTRELYTFNDDSFDFERLH